MSYSNNPGSRSGISSHNTYMDILCSIYKLLKCKDIKFNHFAEIFLDNKASGGINSFQSFDGCTFVETILLFH